MPKEETNLAGGHRLGRNVVWNLLGTGTPLLVAIVAIPILIDGLGTARFGVLTIAWMVVGYFSLFDLGLGRALTKLVAEHLGKGQGSQIPDIVWTAMSLMVALGLVGAIVVGAATRWLVIDVLQVPLELQSETLTAFYLLATSIPVVISTTGLRGVLEAHQRFELVNAVRIPLGVATFLAPVAVLPFSNSLVPVVGILIFSRFLSCCAYTLLVLKVEPAVRCAPRMRRRLIKPLASFGGWMTVTNIVGPMMVYMDRFLIGSLVSITAVAYYATPYEVVTKLWIVPGALMGVVFPAFAATFVRDSDRAALIFRRVVSYIFVSLYPVVFLVITFSYEGLWFWLGSEFAENGAVVLQLLALGVFLNSHARVPSGLIQGAGRPDLNAKLHLLELPFYLVSLWWMLGAYGIIGAAAVWVIRVAIDALVLFWLADRILISASLLNSRPVFILVIALVTILLGASIPSLVVRSLLVLITLPVFAVLAWSMILLDNERNTIKRQLRSFLLKS